ncbi:MAG TPA: 30S ribosomal protein S8, partial [Anaerolineales bacterium]
VVLVNGGGKSMTINDPISDMLTRIRNAVLAGHAQVALPNSRIKAEIAKILKDEGFLEGFEVVDGEQPDHRVLRLKIKYIGERRERRPVISGLERVSTPGRRIYTKKTDIPWVLSGIGVAILSTPKGVMTGARARQLGVGGEILCKVW